MEIIEQLRFDLMKIDKWKYADTALSLPDTVDTKKPIYELRNVGYNSQGIRCRKVFWTNKQGQPRSCEITPTAIIFNGG